MIKWIFTTLKNQKKLIWANSELEAYRKFYFKFPNEHPDNVIWCSERID